MQYPDWINAVAAMLEYDANITDATSDAPSNNSSFNNLIPRAIDYTENRLQRDLDLLGTVVTTPLPGQPPPTMVANQRLQTLPSVDISAVSEVPELLGTPIPASSTLTTTQGSDVVTVAWANNGLTQGENVSIPTPVKVGGLTLGGVFNVTSIIDANHFTIFAPTNATSSGTSQVIGNGIFVVCQQIRPIINGIKQKPLEFVSRDFLDFSWPSDVSPGANIPPTQWTTNDQATFLVGPAPDQPYPFEAMGTMRIPQMSADNYQNFLTIQFPDLYLQCSMIFWFQFQRDFGAQSDNPQTAQSAESQYQLLLKSAAVEETRKKFANQFPSPSYPTGVKAA